MLAIPTVHLNGTSRNELLEQVRNAYTALQDAINVMCKAAPHGRDYYPQTSDAPYELARTQHYNRITKIEEVMKEYLQMYKEIEA